MPQPPLLSIVGRKHAGKTTTAVNLAAENTEKVDDPTIGSRVLDGTDQMTV